MYAEEGKTYKFEFTNGVSRIYRFDGFGNHMKQVWTDIETGEKIHQLPPFISSKPLEDDRTP